MTGLHPTNCIGLGRCLRAVRRSKASFGSVGLTLLYSLQAAIILAIILQAFQTSTFTSLPLQSLQRFSIASFPNETSKPSKCSVGLKSDFKKADVPESAPPTIHEYVMWHEKARACICDPNCEVKPHVLVQRCTPGTSCGGFGDRIRGLNLIFLIAVASKRVLFIDFPSAEYNLFDFTTALLPGAIDWRLPKCNSFKDAPFLNWYLLKRPQFASTPDGNALDLISDNVPRKLKPYPNLSISSNSLLTVTVGLIHRLNKEGELLQLSPSKIKPRDLFRIISRTMFVPSEAVANRVRKALPSRFSEVGYVAIHARIGEDVEENKIARFSQFTNYSEISSALLRCAITSNNGTSRPVFLASDSQSLKTAFMDVAREQGVEVAMIGGKALHVAQPLRRHKGRSAEKVCDDYINVFADLFLLGRAHAIIMNGSGFARAAFYMGNASDFLVGYAGRAVCNSV